jgi:hypothetical protein
LHLSAYNLPMPRRLFPIVVLAILIGAPAQGAPEWALAPSHFGPVKIGMTLSQLNKLLDENFERPDDPQNQERQRCFDVTPKKSPHVSFMMENDHLVRIDIDAAGVATAEGVQVGDSEESVLKVYEGKLKVEPMHDAGPDAHYLTLRVNGYGLRFETDHGKVEAMYAGRFEAVAYAEGCE